jgi:hypothetical protein
MEAAAAARLARLVKLTAENTSSSRSVKSNADSPQLQPAAAKEALASTAGTKRRAADMQQQQQAENKKPRVASAAGSNDMCWGGVHSMCGSVGHGGKNKGSGTCGVGKDLRSQADSMASAAAASPAKPRELRPWQHQSRFLHRPYAPTAWERTKKQLLECARLGLQGEDAWDFMGWAQDGPANAAARAARIAAEMAAAMAGEIPPRFQQRNKP